MTDKHYLVTAIKDSAAKHDYAPERITVNEKKSTDDTLVMDVHFTKGELGAVELVLNELTDSIRDTHYFELVPFKSFYRITVREVI